MTCVVQRAVNGGPNSTVTVPFLLAEAGGEGIF